MTGFQRTEKLVSTALFCYLLIVLVEERRRGRGDNFFPLYNREKSK